MLCQAGATRYNLKSDDIRGFGLVPAVVKPARGGSVHGAGVCGRVMDRLPAGEPAIPRQGRAGCRCDAAAGAASYCAGLLLAGAVGAIKSARETMGSDLRVAAGVHLEGG